MLGILLQTAFSLATLCMAIVVIGFFLRLGWEMGTSTVLWWYARKTK